MDEPIKTGDRVTWVSRAKIYTGTVEAAIDRAWRVHVLADNGKRYFVLRKKLTRLAPAGVEA